MSKPTWHFSVSVLLELHFKNPLAAQHIALALAWSSHAGSVLNPSVKFLDRILQLVPTLLFEQVRAVPSPLQHRSDRQ